ncbi:MAG: YfhO family protein [Prevotella sp.]|nr:YfhO family protein [Prevotella sp.]
MIRKEKSLAAQILPHLGAILCFLAVTYIYFSPVLDGKVLVQSDINQYIGMSQELRAYYQDEKASSVWTGSMFSGMPAYQIGVWGTNPNLIDYVEKPLRILGGDISAPVFTGMLMAYILFLALGFGIIPSILGAFAFSFCSYNIIIIEAGHLTKAWALAYMPIVIAGLLTAIRKKYLLGGLLMTFGLALQIKNNHLQITYYTGILCAVLYIGFLLKALVERQKFKPVALTTGVLAVAVAAAVLSNAANFYSNYEMAEESIRGQSELSQPTESEKQSSGLDKDYAFKWSYGKAETFSLLVPDIHGGASGGTLDASSNVYQQLASQGQQLSADGLQGMPTYWGDQPFTSGPVYVGAIICFLFMLGMLLIRDPMKWTLLIATVLFVFLSWGKNLEWFNDWFFYHFPMYNKFRSVSMALVVPSLTMLIAAVWGLKEFFDIEDSPKRLKALYIAAGITGGLCLFFWLLPDFFFNFTSTGDGQWKAQYPEWFYNALLQDRKDLLSADAGRSLVFILLAATMLWGAVKLKADGQKATVCSAVLAALVLIDLWGVDKRYLNNDSFHNKTESIAATTRQQTAADKFILQDKGLSYRVLNLNDPFNETNTSYFHKSIGGYHAAKLKRYQELIEYHIAPEISRIIQSFRTQNIDSITASFAGLPALNMLNAKYIVYNPEHPPLLNPYALGNAWFVQKYAFADNADAEINALGGLNPRITAIVDKRFEQELTGLNIVPDSTARIVMTEYKPDRVKYVSESKSEGLAVFSEVYYANGWEASIDGQPAPHFRADWTLRAMRIPAGKHEIAFEFVPRGYYAAVTTSRISSGLLILFLLASIVLLFRRKKEEK